MFTALACSLIFSFVFAALAARYRAAERIMIPLVDVLLSVPILGFQAIRHRAFHCDVHRQFTGRGMRRDLCHFYLSGLEHGVQPVPVDARRAGRAG